jgi:glycosyltransferase involved in cell wall biosynthesis
VKKNIWVISELYYPEETSTGYFLTKISEGLANSYIVSVLCSQPTYSARGQRAPHCAVHNGVKVYRCQGSTLNKDRLLFRFINAVTISLSIFFSALVKIRRNEWVIVVTNPPLMMFGIGLVCWLRGASCLLLIHDVYPEALIAAGLTHSGSILSRTLAWLTKALFRNVATIIVIGRDMKQLVLKKMSSCQTPVALITNWADIEEIKPSQRCGNGLLIRLGLVDMFVIQYSGNMGRTHDIESLFGSIKELADHPAYHFLFIGSGAKKESLTKQVQHDGLTNVTILPVQPRDQLSDTLNACDVAIISFIPGMAGVSVPSRLYNIMAAGKPVIAVADENSELALVVKEERIGWIVSPGNVEQIVAVIREAKSDPNLLTEMGKRARRAAEQRYSFQHVMDKYTSLMRDLETETRH